MTYYRVERRSDSSWRPYSRQHLSIETARTTRDYWTEYFNGDEHRIVKVTEEVVEERECAK